jgi:hypothetical protein
MTIFLTIAVIAEGIAIYGLLSRIRHESDRITKLGTGLWVHLRDEHGHEADYVRHPHAAEIDRLTGHFLWHPDL